MIVAVFGDVHGDLAGMYGLCQQWEMERGRGIDLVLQTGDMGLWRAVDEMDKADRREFERRKGQLTTHGYLMGEKEPPIETWLVHGNNENFALLPQCENQPVDPFGRIVFLGPGAVREFRKGREAIRVAGLGGMEYRFGKYPIHEKGRVQKYLHAPSLEQLKEEASVDVLLLHEAPFNKGLRNKFPTGSKRITELIQALKPRFAFFGHYDDPPAPFRLGETTCVGMNFAQARRIPGCEGAMGILRVETWEFEYIWP